MKSNLLLIMPLLINTFEHDHILMRHIPLVNTNTRQKSPHFAEMHRQTGEFPDLFYFMRAGVPHRVLLPHRHFAAEQLPYEIKLNGKMIVEWSDRKDPAHYLYLRSSFPSLCKLYEYKSLRREWFFCADFYVMSIILCLLYYVNHRINPPSTVSTCPVTKLASSLAR